MNTRILPGIVAALMTLASVPALGQNFMSNPSGRRHISLNGEWSTLVDPFVIGSDAAREVYKDKKDSTALFYEYSFEGARRMSVPGDWNHQWPDLQYYEGTVWYSRKFATPQHADRHFLYFAGVSNRCKVYLNGHLLGSHEGAFTPFQFEVGSLLRKGEDNFLCLAVDNIRRPEAIPAMSFDWWNYGGITRDVYLVSTDETFINDYFLRLAPGDDKSIVVSAGVSGPISAKCRIKLSIPSLGIEKSFPVSADGSGSTTIHSRELKLWSLDDPVLYDIKLCLKDGRSETGQIADTVGFRRISVQGEQILLNGKPVFLRGISFHEEIPQEGRRACTPADARQLLQQVRQLGCNMARLSHYPQNEHIVRLADRMGILLWEEIPLWQGIDFGDGSTYSTAVRYLEEMIQRDKNRCSVGLWSLSNETRPGEARNKFLLDLLAHGRRLDSSRLFTSAFSIVQRDDKTGRISMDDPFAEKVDVAGLNMYMGWYVPWDRKPQEYLWDVAVGKPLIFSEFGGEALYGVSGPRDRADTWSEDYQAALYRDNLAMMDGIANLAGVVPWLLYDFRSPYRLHPALQQGWNRKGVLSQHGDRKKAWWILRDYFARKGAAAESAAPIYKDPSRTVEERVEDLLGRMTLKEKALQLVQYSLGRNTNMNNVGGLIDRLPAEAGSAIYHGDTPELRNFVQKRAVEQSRLGIPMLFGYDVIHGFKTIFPIPLAQACSWNPALAEEACAIAAAEARSTGIEWTFSPMVDIGRDPRWGRVAEGYGEDPYTNSVFAAAAVSGYQGRGAAKGDFSELSDNRHILACLKHFVGYGASEAGRDYVYTEISDQTLWDTYLPPYEAGIKAGALTVMSGFNDISGIPATAHKKAMTDILRKKLGFDGAVISDWGAIAQLQYQGYSPDLKEAAAAAFDAGVDIDMQSNAYDTLLESLVAEGRIPQGAVDDAVRRVLRLKFQLGLFENPYTPVIPEKERFLQPGALKAAAQMAAESMVLLKNADATLPLKGKGKIAVIGPFAENRSALLGSWAARGKAEDALSILDALRQEFDGKGEIRFAQGCTPEGEFQDLEQALTLGRWADAIILCLGEKENWSGENASKADIALPGGQAELVHRLRALDKPIAVILLNGRPLELGSIAEEADAILEAWQPGTCGASAISGIISGRINPSGKLSISFPYSTGQIPIHYNRRHPARLKGQGNYIDQTSEPLFPFGHGLSYSSFEYGDIQISKPAASPEDTLRLSITVTNTSDVDGTQTLHWYICDKYASITRPMKELKHFERKEIKAGESATFSWTLVPERDLSFVDGNGDRHLEAGEFIIYAHDRQISITL